MSGLPRTQVHVQASVWGVARFSLLLPEKRKFRQSVASRPGKGQEKDEHREQARDEQEPGPAKHAVKEGFNGFPAGGVIGH